MVDRVQSLLQPPFGLLCQPPNGMLRSVECLAGETGVLGGNLLKCHTNARDINLCLSTRTEKGLNLLKLSS
jgi:hypothetical protein